MAADQSASTHYRYMETVQGIPVLGLKEYVVLPLGAFPKSGLRAGRKRSVNAVRWALQNNNGKALLLAQKNASAHPSPDDFYDVGVVAELTEPMEVNEEIQFLPLAKSRAVVTRLDDSGDILTADVRVVQDGPIPSSEKREVEQLSQKLLKAFEYYYQKTNRGLSYDDQTSLANETKPGRFADRIAFYCYKPKDSRNLHLTYQQLQRVLDTLDPRERLQTVYEMTMELLDLASIEEKLSAQVKEQVEKTQREYYLSEKLKAIQKELGRDGSDTEELRERVEEANMSDEAEEKALKEIDRLDMLPPMSSEAGVARSYVDWLLSLPWDKKSDATVDIGVAAEMLDEDHYGLKKVKERILEYLAVMKLAGESRGPILCFTGPPGVGKTSLGRSIARATGREFVRMSLGGVRDEAEIRGHRRTYIGAIPGRVMHGIRDAKTKNPFFLLDEVDKMGRDFRGDPAAALLEVLDPEQNNTFRDHYLDVAFDLSDVMFLTTANVLPAIPPALQDRMEIIELPGYTEFEKGKIARHFLIPKQIKQHGLQDADIRITDGAVSAVIQSYTREAGVRGLEREMTKICRKIARQIVDNSPKKKAKERKDDAEKENAKEKKGVSVTARNISQYLGPPQYTATKAELTDHVGVAQGLVYTQVGGDVISIETTMMQASADKAELTLTGRLGEVMRESAQTALSCIRSKTKEYDLESFDFKRWDMHIHVPEGAVPKEGPSAGITLATAMLSSLTGRPVRKDVAMTGEITLRGNVLPIGGIKEKLLAAHRVGIKEALIPKGNVKDLEDIPLDIRQDMKIQPVDHIDQVIERALLPKVVEESGVDPPAAFPAAPPNPTLPPPN